MCRYVKTQSDFNCLIDSLELFVDLRMSDCKNKNSDSQLAKNRFLKIKHKFEISIENVSMQNISVIIDENNNNFDFSFDDSLNIVIKYEQYFFNELASDN